MIQTCTITGKKFTIFEKDKEFYKTLNIPLPILHPLERARKRLAWRNDHNLYKRKCNKTGKTIISMYPPNTPFPVYEFSEWWKDDWDPMKYGQSFDFTKPFFDQYLDLRNNIPRLSLGNSNTENCEYSNHIANSKNCYMSTVVFYNCEDILYSDWIYKSKNCIDCYFCENCEGCYECLQATNCYECFWGEILSHCYNCYFSIDLKNCKNCLFCNNLRNKEYYIFNTKVTKEEFEEKKQKIFSGSYIQIQKALVTLEKIRSKTYANHFNNRNCDDCQGDNLKNCKDIYYGFNLTKSENCRYMICGGEYAKNVYDSIGGSFEWSYNCHYTGWSSMCIGCNAVHHSHNMYHCDNCLSNCFECIGCVGLQSKSYCILNKQYSKEEYFVLKEKIIEYMKKTREWGEFFPLHMAPFPYNDSLAQDFFPLTKKDNSHWNIAWKEKTFPKSSATIAIPDSIHEMNNSTIETTIFTCKNSKQPFKITKKELQFYKNYNIPLPRLCFKERFKRRFETKTQPKFWERACCKCDEKIKTSYSPDRSENILCEKCYLEEIY